MSYRFAAGALLASLVAFVACTSDDGAGSPSTSVDAGVDGAKTAGDSGTSSDDDAATDAGVEVGEPITAPANQWTFVPFADSACANGSPTGIGINPGTSKRLVVYLEGGGACWDPNTCYVFNTASNLDGWDEKKFKVRAGTMTGGHLDRQAANNPYKDASFVYIPYCTGDVHGGDKEQTYDGQPTKHVGRRNIQAFLKRIAPTFEDADRVVLTGSSAGGFGAALSYWRFAEAFGGTRVDLVDDSGPPFPKEKIKFFETWMKAWDLQGALPPDCTDCKDGNVSAILPYYGKTYPTASFALLSYDQDATISGFYGMTGQQFQTALADVTTTFLDPIANLRVFELAGKTHTMLGKLTTKAAGDRELGAWLTDMNGDSDAWKSVKPVTEN